MVKRYTPKTEAITIISPREDETYASVMKRVVKGVNLKDNEIATLGKIRRTKTGAVLIEVQDKEEADKLESLFKNAVGEAA